MFKKCKKYTTMTETDHSHQFLLPSPRTSKWGSSRLWQVLLVDWGWSLQPCRTCTIHLTKASLQIYQFIHQGGMISWWTSHILSSQLWWIACLGLTTGLWTSWPAPNVFSICLLFLCWFLGLLYCAGKVAYQDTTGSTSHIIGKINRIFHAFQSLAKKISKNTLRIFHSQTELGTAISMREWNL